MTFANGLPETGFPQTAPDGKKEHRSSSTTTVTSQPVPARTALFEFLQASGLGVRVPLTRDSIGMSIWARHG